MAINIYPLQYVMYLLVLCVCPEIWKEAKVIPLPRDNTAFTGPNSCPISLLPVLSKL